MQTDFNCVQRTLCPKYTIWDKTTCRCVKSQYCAKQLCPRGWKFDKTACECYKKSPVIQRYLCPAGTSFCEYCGKCIDSKGCYFYQPKCKKGKEILDETVCECINNEETCIQKYLCIEDFQFDFDKCICVEK